MKLRWFKRIREYRNWDDIYDEYFFTRYEDQPILQYWDEKKHEWKDIPEVKETKKMY